MGSQDIIRSLEKEIMALRKQLAEADASAEADTSKAALAACKKSCDNLKAKIASLTSKNAILNREIDALKHSIRTVNYTVDKILPDDD